MDLSKYNLEVFAEQGVDMELMDPISGDVLKQDNGDPVTIHLLGMDSKAFKQINRKQQRRRTEKMLKSRGNKIDYSVSEEDRAEMLAAVTTGWSPGLEEDGEIIEYSEDAAYDLYLKYAWIAEQADKFIAERANFFPS